LIKKVLIANRGEIALRIIRTCRELGVKTVSVYSTADRDSLAVRFADEAVCIGPPPASESYLKFDRIIAAAEVTGADAIHPGYGFLAENADFAEVCADHGIIFIGPSPDTIRRMGDKSVAKATMVEANVPVVPGSDGEVSDIKEAKRLAADIGYPVMIKASAGGGGRGMRMVEKESDFEKQFRTASEEARSAFGYGGVYLEKLVLRPRHIEVQIVGDGQGNVIHFGERECSIQRRHQKLLEEAPSPIMDPDLRERMCQAAIDGALAVNYSGAGTVEFLLDQDRNFYFMEMNTRIQVEHPVTEEITDTDLIALQLSVANGERLSSAHDFVFQGHAIECRINAEDPYRDFSPSPGTITGLHTPKGHGVRCDTHVYAGYKIPPNYDSMIAKLIVHCKTRPLAIRKMRRALDEFVIEGVKTTIPFHRQLMDDERFQSGDFDTGFLAGFQIQPPAASS